MYICYIRTDMICDSDILSIVYNTILYCTLLYTALWYFLSFWCYNIRYIWSRCYRYDCHLDGVPNMIIHLSISHQECRIIGWTAHTEEMTKFSGNVMTALQTALQVTLQSCHDCSSFIARSETSYCSKPQFLLCSLAHSHTHTSSSMPVMFLFINFAQYT